MWAKLPGIDHYKEQPIAKQKYMKCSSPQTSSQMSFYTVQLNANFLFRHLMHSNAFAFILKKTNLCVNVT